MSGGACKSAESLLDELGITEPELIRIEAIAEYCNATIVYEELTGCEARILGCGDRAIITVNTKAPRSRQRFSAAHELGHWMYDRGRVAFACTESALVRGWADSNPEKQANRYAADLLLPPVMFSPLAKSRHITHASASELARRFDTSLTATAIRLVEFGSYPSMVICSENGRRKWFSKSSIVPRELMPQLRPGTGSLAAALLNGTARTVKPEDVDADEWIDHPAAHGYCVHEDSVRIGDGMVLTLLWWRDERQILDLDDDNDDDD